jgi:glucosamine--fructose-6-phosphate aminotransferase (isomerizing)
MTPAASPKADILWADIQAQAENMRQVIAHLYGPERPRLVAAARFMDNDRPTVFIGMGSAAYLCMPAEAYLAANGRFASTMYASEALYIRLPALRRANVVLNTRSGQTVELVKLAEALANAGIPFVAITNEPASPVARLATHIVWSNTRKDDLVSINVVTAMMATTLLLAAESLGQADALRPDFEALADGLADAVRRASQEADALADRFAPIRPIHLLYRGASQGAAYCGRLVLEEVGRHPGAPFEMSDFRQGPIEVADERFGAVVFAPEGELGGLSLGLAGQLAAVGGRIMAVGSATGLAACPPGIHRFPVASLSAPLRPVLEVIPLQLLAYTLAARQGYTPGTVRFISKVITSETEMAGM